MVVGSQLLLVQIVCFFLFFDRLVALMAVYAVLKIPVYINS